MSDKLPEWVMEALRTHVKCGYDRPDEFNGNHGGACECHDSLAFLRAVLEPLTRHFGSDLLRAIDNGDTGHPDWEQMRQLLTWARSPQQREE